MQKSIEELRNANLELESLKARKDAIKKAALEHRDTITDAEIDTNKQELVRLNEEIATAEKRVAELSKQNENIKGENNMEIENRETELTKVMEQRGADLKAGKEISFKADQRSLTIADAGAIVETKYSRTLNNKPNEVSSLIDNVNSIPVQGGNSYTKGFEISGGEGDYTTELGDANEANSQFGYVDIGKAKITAYTELSEDLMVLPNVDYANIALVDIRNALRKKITKQIVNGAGTTNTIKGIINADASCGITNINETAIDADTLDEIVFSLGGDEDVAENGILILNKQTLKAFAQVKGTNEKRKIYKVTQRGNRGTIEYADGGTSVEYIINSALPSFASASNTNPVMIYGLLNTYELPIFSDITVKMSTDSKFREGMTCYRGSVYVGGAVAAYKSFVVVKKSA